MLIDELLRRLHAKAGAPEGTFKARTLEDWAYEELIRGPVRGSRDWPDESLADATDVIAYRSRGFKRSAAIRLQRWLESESPGNTVDRIALSNEVSRGLRLLIRSVTSTHGLNSNFKLTEYRKNALLRSLGPLAPILQDADCDLGSAVTLLIYEIGRFGQQITQFDRESEPLAAMIADWTSSSGIHPLAGVCEPDPIHEFSVIGAIEKLTPEELEQCRSALNASLLAWCMAPWAIKTFTFGMFDEEEITAVWSAVINTLDRWPWRIIYFAVFANMIYNQARDSEVVKEV